MLPGEVRIQRALKLANVDLGVVRMSWHPLLVPTLFPLVGFSMQLLDRWHHPYISTGFGRKHFYSLVSILFMVCKLQTCSRLSFKSKCYYAATSGIRANVPWSWRMVPWVVRMSWYTPPLSTLIRTHYLHASFSTIHPKERATIWRKVNEMCRISCFYVFQILPRNMVPDNLLRCLSEQQSPRDRCSDRRLFVRKTSCKWRLTDKRRTKKLENRHRQTASRWPLRYKGKQWVERHVVLWLNHFYNP